MRAKHATAQDIEQEWAERREAELFDWVFTENEMRRERPGRAGCLTGAAQLNGKTRQVRALSFQFTVYSFSARALRATTKAHKVKFCITYKKKS